MRGMISHWKRGFLGVSSFGLTGLSFALVLLLPSLASAQLTAEQKKETIKWVLAQEAPDGGFYLAPQTPNVDARPTPSLRATNAAVRALKYLGADVPKKDKHAAFVLSCFDPKTGGFAEAGGKPDVATTSIGVMVAVELDVPKEKYAKAMDYLKENAKTFEEVRIGAAAVEAWGVKDCPFKLDRWEKINREFLEAELGIALNEPKDGGARTIGSSVAMHYRLGGKIPRAGEDDDLVRSTLGTSQRDDGGWNKKGEKASDIETTYRVMRALMLLKEPPKDAKKLRAFLELHRNKDGGYATKPGDKSSVGGVYYCVIVTKWLDEMEAKK